jgi:hypothetical protein
VAIGWKLVIMIRLAHTETSSSDGSVDAGICSVRAFVRSGFSVRCQVVKLWRSLPLDLWTGLSTPDDRRQARARERRALWAVLGLALALWLGFSHAGLLVGEGSTAHWYPLLGKSLVVSPGHHGQPGWYYDAEQSTTLALWVIVPSLLGWAFVRLLWLPVASAGKPTQQATMTLARHLGGVYAYVYLMIALGATLMVPLILLAPARTETFRWYLWCFLFGESFFVPGVMWARLVLRDRAGYVFGRFRHVALTLYLVLCVVVPILGMVQELD